MLITFSGLDGAGKTTQIELFTQYLKENNYRFKKLSMFDNVSISAFLRKGFKNKPQEVVFDSTTNKTYRYDKNKKDSRTIFLRKFAYFIDFLTLLIKRLYYQKVRKSLLVMDRYLYDSLANLFDTNSEKYIKFMLRLIPKPDLAILLDVEPSIAFNRKSEYPPEFYVGRRDAYLEIFKHNSGGFIVNSNGISATQNRIQELFREVYAGSRIKTDELSPYVDLILTSLLKEKGDLGLLENFNYSYLLKVLQKNRITVRWFNKTKWLFNNEFKDKIELILKEENNRLKKTIELTGKIIEEFKKCKLRLLVIKTLDNYPDLGHDVDMFTDAPIKEIDNIFLSIFKAKLEIPSLPEKIAHKRNYKIDGFATFELHCAKLGELGEETFLAKDLISNYETAQVGGITVHIPKAEYRLLITVLQRIYRHFNIRICDIYNTMQLIQNNLIDWQYLKKISRKYGIWEGVSLYLSYINKIALYYGIELSIKQHLGNKNWPVYIKDRNMHFRFSLISTGLNIYFKKVIFDIQNLNFYSLSRLPLFIPLSLMHYFSVKLFGKSKIW